MLEKVNKILKRLEEVEAQLANPAAAKDRARFRDLSREHADLQEIAGVARRLQSVCDQIAQAKEMLEDPDRKIYRPRQIYTGEVQRDYVPIGQR